MPRLASFLHFFVMHSDMLRLRHHLQVAGIVVVLIAVDVMNNLVSLQRPPQHLLGNYPMLMPTKKLAIRSWLQLGDSLKHCSSAVGSALGFRRDVVGIAIAAHSLSVHSAHSAGTLFGGLAATFNAARLSHGFGKRIPGTVGEIQVPSVVCGEFHWT